MSTLNALQWNEIRCYRPRALPWTTRHRDDRRVKIGSPPHPGHRRRDRRLDPRCAQGRQHMLTAAGRGSTTSWRGLRPCVGDVAARLSTCRRDVVGRGNGGHPDVPPKRQTKDAVADRQHSLTTRAHHMSNRAPAAKRSRRPSTLADDRRWPHPTPRRRRRRSGGRHFALIRNADHDVGRISQPWPRRERPCAAASLTRHQPLPRALTERVVAQRRATVVVLPRNPERRRDT